MRTGYIGSRINRNQIIDFMQKYSYIARVKALLGSSIIAYFPLDESSGDVAFDQSGNGYNGSFSGVVLNNVIGPDRVTNCPLFDGSNDYVNIYSAGFASAFNPNSGSAIIWAKQSSVDNWTDGSWDQCIFLKDTDGKALYYCKHANNNTLYSLYNTEGALVGNTTDKGWMLLGLSWSSSDDTVTLWKNGYIVGTYSFPANPLGTLLSTGCCVGNNQYTAADQPWNGWLAHAIFMNRSITSSEMRRLYTIAKPTAAGGQANYAISIGFDDGDKSVYDAAFAYMESIGLHKATVYIIKANADNETGITWTQLQEMYAAGWDISNHLSNHDVITNYTVEQCEATIGGCTDAIDAHNMPRGSHHLAYPFGINTTNSNTAMANLGMLSGRTVVEPGNFDFTTTSMDKIHLPATVIILTTTVDTVRSHIQAAVANHTSLILYAHKIVENPVDAASEWSIANYQELMDWIKAEHIQLKTISEMITAIDNGI